MMSHRTLIEVVGFTDGLITAIIPDTGSSLNVTVCFPMDSVLA
jgi:hypothetical protein